MGFSKKKLLRWLHFQISNIIHDEDIIYVHEIEPGFAPKRASDQASGYDLKARILPDQYTGDSPYIEIGPGERAIVKVGFIMDPTRARDITIRPRSSFSRRGCYVMLGTIDTDYRGEAEIHLVNFGTETIMISHGQRIAQMVMGALHTPKVELIEAHKLSSTKRGDGGFGSTGNW